MVRWLGALLLASGLTACGADSVVARTQLMLVCDTDLALGDPANPESVAKIQFDVDGNGKHASADAPVSPADPPPRSLGLVQENSSSAAITVSATALNAAGKPIVSRSHIVSFVKGQTLVVPLHLARACVHQACPGNRVCTEHGCGPRELDMDALEPWSGSTPMVSTWPDGGMTSTPDDGGGVGGMDAGKDASAPARDAGADAQAQLPDGSAPQDAGALFCGDSGSPVDTTSDPRHCGSCTNACPDPNNLQNHLMSAPCMASACVLTCEAGFGNCNKTISDGCEADLTSPLTCGDTCTKCNAGHPKCVAGKCVK